MGTMDVTEDNDVTRTIGNENNRCSCVSHETKVKQEKVKQLKGETSMSHYEST